MGEGGHPLTSPLQPHGWLKSKAPKRSTQKVFPQFSSMQTLAAAEDVSHHPTPRPVARAPPSASVSGVCRARAGACATCARFAVELRHEGCVCGLCLSLLGPLLGRWVHGLSTGTGTDECR